MSSSSLWQFGSLISLHQDGQTSKTILETDVCTLGRSPTCQIVVQNKIVSRLHARIELDEGRRYILHDAESANGTFVNGHRISEPYLLRDGDEIGLGIAESIFRFEDPEETLHAIRGRLRYNKEKMAFFVDKKQLELTSSQGRLLQHLYNHAYQICTRESCIQVLWGREYIPVVDDLALNRVMSNLRKKLAQDKFGFNRIVTHRGMGYMLVLD